MSRQDAAERQWGRGRALPHLAEVLDQCQAVLPPGEATLVDADAEVGGAGLECRRDLGEHDLLDGAFTGVEQPIEQGRGGVFARAQHAGRA